MGLKYPIDFKVAFSKSLYFYSHIKNHRLPEISEKVHITAKFQKTVFDATINMLLAELVLLVLHLFTQYHGPNC